MEVMRYALGSSFFRGFVVLHEVHNFQPANFYLTEAVELYPKCKHPTLFLVVSKLVSTFAP